MYHVHQTTRDRRPRFTNGSRRRKRVFADIKHTMETSHWMCRTRYRTASRVRGKNRHLIAPHEVRGETRRHVSHFTECAEDKIKQVSYFGKVRGWTKQRILHSSAQERHGFALLRVRGHRTCSWQGLPSGNGAIYQDWSTTPKRMTMNDPNNAELFLMG